MGFVKRIKKAVFGKDIPKHAKEILFVDNDPKPKESMYLKSIGYSKDSSTVMIEHSTLNLECLRCGASEIPHFYRNPYSGEIDLPISFCPICKAEVKSISPENVEKDD